MPLLRKQATLLIKRVEESYNKSFEKESFFNDVVKLSLLPKRNIINKQLFLGAKQCVLFLSSTDFSKKNKKFTSTKKLYTHFDILPVFFSIKCEKEVGFFDFTNLYTDI